MDTHTFVCVHVHSCAPVQTRVCVNVVDWLLQAPGGRTQREGSTGKKRGSRLQQSTAAAIVPAGGTGNLSLHEPGPQICLAERKGYLPGKKSLLCQASSCG